MTIMAIPIAEMLVEVPLTLSLTPFCGPTILLQAMYEKSHSSLFLSVTNSSGRLFIFSIYNNSSALSLGPRPCLPGFEHVHTVDRSVKSKVG